MPSVLDIALKRIYDRKDARVGLTLLRREALCDYVESLEIIVDQEHKINGGRSYSVKEIREDVAAQYNFTGETQ